MERRGMDRREMDRRGTNRMQYSVPFYDYDEAKYTNARMNAILRERIALGLTGGAKKKKRATKKKATKKRATKKKVMCKKRPKCQDGSNRDYKCRKPDGSVAMSAKAYNALMKKKKVIENAIEDMENAQFAPQSKKKNRVQFDPSSMSQSMSTQHPPVRFNPSSSEGDVAMSRLTKKKKKKSSSDSFDDVDNIFFDEVSNSAPAYLPPPYFPPPPNMPLPQRLAIERQGYRNDNPGATTTMGPDWTQTMQALNSSQELDSNEVEMLNANSSAEGMGGRMRRCPNKSRRKRVCVTKNNRIVKPKRKVRGGCNGCPYCAGGGCMACEGSGIMAGGKMRRCPDKSRRKRVCVTKRGKIVKPKKGKSSNPWIKHYTAFRKKHAKQIKREDLSLAEVAEWAKETYKPKRK